MKRPLLLLAACVCLLGATASAQTNTVTGTALFRERIALPENAVFEAQIEDVSRADAPAQIVAFIRRERTGHPPYSFAIPYDPARIDAKHRYSVRARITVDGGLRFITDESYPVLTGGHSNKIERTLIMKSAVATAPMVPEPPRAALSNLPATFIGELPCADCTGPRYVLNLYADNSFFQRVIYLGKPGVKPLDEIGRWTLSSDGSTIILHGGKEASERFRVVSPAVLRKLDMDGKEIDSKLDYNLARTPYLQILEPRLGMRGMFKYLADAAVFTECLTGRSFPVAQERAYIEAERAYLKHRNPEIDPILIAIEGQLAMRPKPDSGSTLTVVIARFSGIFPGESCGQPLATSDLAETYWKLTAINDQPVIVNANQREPHLLFRKQENRIAGFTGCNQMGGPYQLAGNDEVKFGPIVSTMMACVPDNDTERLFMNALNQVRRWKVVGQHLELYDAEGSRLARFEARAMK